MFCSHSLAFAFIHASDRLLINGLDFSLPKAGIVGVIGPNGAGKVRLAFTCERARTIVLSLKKNHICLGSVVNTH